jgi:hypothetical protein
MHVLLYRGLTNLGDAVGTICLVDLISLINPREKFIVQLQFVLVSTCIHIRTTVYNVEVVLIGNLELWVSFFESRTMVYGSPLLYFRICLVLQSLKKLHVLALVSLI